MSYIVVLSIGVWIIENWELIFGLISPIVAYLVGNRKRKLNLKAQSTEVDSSSSDVISKNLLLYQAMLDDIELRYEQRLDKVYKEMEAFEKQNTDLKIIITDLNTKISELTREVKKLRNNVVE